MSIWGKLAGAAAGLAIGGPIGALVGGVAGHYAIDRDGEQEGQAENQVAFTVGVIALGAKMAKADGVVTMNEVQAFKEVFKVPEGEMKNVARVFNLAKQDVAGYEAYAEQLATMFKGNRNCSRMCSKVCSTSPSRTRRCIRTRSNSWPRWPSVSASPRPSSATSRRGTSRSAKRNPYDVLGIKPGVANDELKSQYRKLVAENHPDKLIARGVPPEFISIATEKVATINEAYGQIAKERGI